MTIISLPGGWVALRSINGHDERTVEAVDLPAALDLLDRLLIDRPGTLIGHGGAGKLTVAARDRVLAAVYSQIYGSMIASTVRCIACAKPFDVSFALGDLVAAQVATDTRPDTIFQTGDGWQFRLVTGDDELAVFGLAPDVARRALLERCSHMPDPPDDATFDHIERHMEHIAPLVNVNLSAVCVECGREQLINFDIQSFLLARLIKDKTRLMSEVHSLAVTYHWGLEEILALKRTERRQYLALIEAEARRMNMRAAGGRRRTGA